jgi:hypothetical protein
MTPELFRYQNAVHESLRLPNAWGSDGAPDGPGALRLARRNLAALLATRSAIDAGHGFDDFLGVLEDAKAATPLARAEVRRLAEAAYSLACECHIARRDSEALDADLVDFAEPWLTARHGSRAGSEWLAKLIELNLRAFEAVLKAQGVPLADIVSTSHQRRAAAFGRAG